MTEPKSNMEVITSTVQILSIIAGVVISVMSFNSARVKEAEARALEADRPFVELRRSVYLEAAKTAAILANPENRSAEELAEVKRRFRELYVAELTMVEDGTVEAKMVNLAEAVDPSLRDLSDAQRAALNLARALRVGYINPHARAAP